MNFFTLKKRLVPAVGILIVFAAGYYIASRQASSDKTDASAMVVHTAESGTVSTGIETTGTIEAAEILDLNVYKTTNRIDVLAVENGMYVETGDLLFAFDQSDVAVDISESQLTVREAQLAYTQEKESAVEPNTTIASLTNEIAVMEQRLSDYKQDRRDALRTFLNEYLEAEPSEDRFDQQVDRAAPTVGGLYASTEQGEYRIRVYASAAASGYSFTVRGLESGAYELFPGAEVDLGTRGLTITFPNLQAIQNRDEWVIAVPNTGAPEYITNLEDYEDAMQNIEESIETDTVSLNNKRTQLAQTERTDTGEDRDLAVDSAQLAIERAQVNLERNLETLNERRITAPFAGTVEGMENVVVGATPKNDNSDSIDLGVLISDTFLVTFSLSATDVDKVSVGQQVNVTLTSLPESMPLSATIVEISSLPDSSSVAQYSVKAEIQPYDETETRLRDGMLADIVIVQSQVQNVLRVPTSALTYKEGKAYVTIVEGLTEAQSVQAARMGIVRKSDTATPATYTREIALGLRGTYYAEVTDGLTGGEIIVITQTSSDDTAGTDAVRAGFGSGAGMRPPRD